MNIEVACFKIGFTIRSLKICDIYLNSKYSLNQITSLDSRNFAKFLGNVISRESFLKLGETLKKRQGLPKLVNINQ